MTSFLLYSVLLLLAALLFIAIPVIRYRPVAQAGDDAVRKQKNIQLFKQGLAELEKDRQEDAITVEDFEKLKAELERGFLRDMEEIERSHTGAMSRPGKLIPILCLLFIPLFSYSLYEVVGSARDLALPDILDELSQAETTEQQLEGLNELAVFLQERFERREDDIQNGYMLGTLYIELENYPAAIDTFTAMAEAMEESPDKATVLGQLAQSYYLDAGSMMTPEVQQVVDQALAINPNEYAVMSLLAIESFINEEFGQAVTFWRRQLMQLDATSQEAVVLRDRIERVEGLLAQAPGEEGEATVAEGPSVTIVVDIDDSILDQVDDFSRLFVYARNPAMPMPLAAQNLALPDFPFEITLDDSMAMIAGMTLSTAQNIIVGARLSRSGQAIAEPGDIQAISEPFVLSEQEEPVTLTIKDIVVQ